MEEEKTGVFFEIIEWVVTIGIAIVVALFIVGNIGGPSKVSGESMEPNFHDGDTVIINRLAYRFNQVEKGDVIVLNTDKEGNGLIYNMLNEGKDVIDNMAYTFNISNDRNTSNLVKRVVATEGDIVDMKEGRVYINGEEETDYGVKGYTFPYSDIEYPLTVKEGEVFVLGDNRENSLDSRGLGVIKLEQIKGRVGFRILPFSRFGKTK